MNIAEVIGWKFDHQPGMCCKDVDGVITIVEFPGGIPSQAEQDAWSTEYAQHLVSVKALEMELRLEAYTDEVAQNGPRRYRNAESCVSYITTSKDPQVVAEAQAYADWRDDFWNAAEAMKADVLDGLRTAPTYEEAIDELPKMVWP